MADAGSNLGKLTPKYDFSQYRYREIASRSLTNDNPGAKWKIGDKPIIGSYFHRTLFLCVFSIAIAQWEFARPVLKNLKLKLEVR